MSLIEVLAYDNGTGSGWAYLSLQAEDLGAVSTGNASFLAVDSGEFGGPAHRGMSEFEVCNKLVELALVGAPCAALVFERFTLRKFNSSREFLSAERINFGLSYDLWLQGDERQIFWQSPEMAKTTMPNERLKAMGKDFYRPGKRWKDANDAMRHAITFLRRAADKPDLRKRAWPAAFG